MINAGINDGDIAIIKQQSTANDGDIVVAIIDDSVTLKRFFKEATRIRLQAENPDFNPIYSQDVKVLGKLSHIIREY
jgi:repressor LexA